MKTFKKGLLFLIFITISLSMRSNTDRNILFVYINSYDQLFVESELTEINDLRTIVKRFFFNPFDNHNYAEMEEGEIPDLGKVMVSKGVISIQCERNTTYDFYIKVQDEIEKAFYELRNELALKKYGVQYKRLNERKKYAIRYAIPVSISEAEPLYIRNSKWEVVPNPAYSWYFSYIKRQK